MKTYTCICGFSCENSQKFNGHKRHCKEHLTATGKYDLMREADKRAAATGRKGRAKASKIKKQEAKINTLDIWISEQHCCEKCGKIMTEKFGSGKFCSRSCANSRTHSAETKLKIGIKFATVTRAGKAISTSKQNSLEKQNIYNQNPNFCKICGSSLPYEKRFRKTCSEICHQKSLREAGKTAASKICKRSHNEILFCTLCENYFGKDKVLHNIPMFNGWDADIILLDHKIAVLWNGPWHYRKILDSQSLSQVQNRDNIKIAEIVAAGYTPYIIEDAGAKRMKDIAVETEFNKFLNYFNF